MAYLANDFQVYYYGNCMCMKMVCTIFTQFVLHPHIVAVRYYLSTNNLIFMIIFKCSTPMSNNIHILS